MKKIVKKLAKEAGFIFITWVGIVHFAMNMPMRIMVKKLQTLETKLANGVMKKNE